MRSKNLYSFPEFVRAHATKRKVQRMTGNHIAYKCPAIFRGHWTLGKGGRQGECQSCRPAPCARKKLGDPCNGKHYVFYFRQPGDLGKKESLLAKRPGLVKLRPTCGGENRGKGNFSQRKSSCSPWPRGGRNLYQKKWLRVGVSGAARRAPIPLHRKENPLKEACRHPRRP